MPTSRVPFAGWSGESSNTQRDWLRPSRLSHSSRDVATCLILSVPLSNTNSPLSKRFCACCIWWRLYYAYATHFCTFANSACLFKKNLWNHGIYPNFFFFFIALLIERFFVQLPNTSTHHWWLDYSRNYCITFYIHMHVFCCKKCWISNSFYIYIYKPDFYFVPSFFKSTCENIVLS